MLSQMFFHWYLLLNEFCLKQKINMQKMMGSIYKWVSTEKIAKGCTLLCSLLKVCLKRTRKTQQLQLYSLKSKRCLSWGLCFEYFLFPNPLFLVLLFFFYNFSIELWFRWSQHCVVIKDFRYERWFISVGRLVTVKQMHLNFYSH